MVAQAHTARHDRLPLGNGEAARRLEKAAHTLEERGENPFRVRAYRVAADRYYNHPDIAADALFHEGLAYQKEAARAGYDQGTAGKSIAASIPMKDLARIQRHCEIEMRRRNLRFFDHFESVKRRKWRCACLILCHLTTG